MPTPPLKPAAVEKAIRALLDDARLADAALRDQLEQLALAHPAFNGFTWLWGPALYRRNRILFRPFILGRFSNFIIVSRHKWKPVKWKGAIGQALEAWIAEADRNDDVELFRRLLVWKLTPPGSGRLDSNTFRDQLLRRFKAADSPAVRQMVLQKFDTWFALDEATALAIYGADPRAATPYILRRLPWSWFSEKRNLWEVLWKRALAGDDPDFAWALYRRQAPVALWEKDAMHLCGAHREPAQLMEELEKRHPQGTGLDLGKVFTRLLEKRGRDVMPYIMRHLRQVASRWLGFGSYGAMLDLARKKQWLDLWSALVRICARSPEFNKEVMTLLNDAALPESEVRRRLQALAGVSREMNLPGLGFARVHQLDEAAALRLYQRFPDILRGPFKTHLQISPWGEKYLKLIEHFIAVKDEALIDFVASRLVTRGGYFGQTKKLVPEIEMMAGYYEALRGRDEAGFSRRAANALAQVPAFSIVHYNDLIRRNRLARLLFERSAASYLADPLAVSDLVEGAEIHVMALGYRALGLDDERARAQAANHLTLLLGTLLRPLQRATRMLAFRALLNAATTADHARIILHRAREALDLPDIKYPKEQLIGLIGSLLHRWPELRREHEQPVVYRRLAA